MNRYICKQNPCWTTFSFTIFITFNVSVNSTCAQPPPLPGWPPGIGIFWALDGKFPWGGDFWAVKSPGVGTKKENKCPVPRQHCNIFIDRTVDVRFFVLINVFLCNGARILTILTTNRRHAPVYGFSTDIKLLTLKLIERCKVICYE